MDSEDDRAPEVVAAAREYAAARAAELRKVENDARAERGLGSSLSACAADSALFREPEDGVTLSPDGEEVDCACESDGRRTLKSKLVGINALKKRSALTSFDNAGTPFTLRDLRSMGATPDLTDGSGGGGATKAAAAAGGSGDFGQCLDEDWFYEAGGVDWFLNAITASAAKARKAATSLGTRGDAETDAPTSKAPAVSPITAYARWVVEKSRRKAAEVEAAAPGELGPTDEQRRARQAVAVAEREAAASEMLASKFWDSITETKEITPAHVAWYLFEPSGRERPCVCGERCISRIAVCHPQADPDDEACARRRAGVVLKEFLTDAEREQFDKFGTLPETRKPCILCIRCKATFDYFMAGLGVIRWAPQTYYHPVDVPGGYRRSACLQPRRTSTKGVCTPTRKFVTDDYLPTTLDQAILAGAVPLTRTELRRLCDESAAFRNAENADIAGERGLPLLRGYVEAGRVMHMDATRELSPQAVSLGSEPGVDYVAAFAAAASKRGGVGDEAQEKKNGDGQFDSYPFFFAGEDPEAAATAALPETDRTSCCDLGEFKGKWRHLIIECSVRLGITPETMSVVLGPFVDLCKAITAAVEASDEGRDNELATIVRDLREWSRTPPPEPLSRHAILLGCLLRSQIAEDVRNTVDMDAVDIASRKARARGAADENAAAKAALTGALAHDSWDAFARAAAASDASPDDQKALEEGPDAWHARKQQTRAAVVAEARKKFAARLLPYPAPTRAQRAIQERVAGVPAETGLAALVSEKKRPSQKTLDRVLQVVSELDAAQRPLRRALVWARDAGLQYDDAALLGVDVADANGPSLLRKPAYCRAAFGWVDPDARTHALRTPRRPLRLTISAASVVVTKAAECRFASSGLPPHARPPAPAPFAVPSVPVCRVRFPTHREALRNAVCVDDAAGSPDVPALALLDEFWKAAFVMAKMPQVTERRVLQTCALPGLALPAADDVARRSIVAVALARVALAEKIQARAVASGDDVLSLRAHAFAQTHADLMCAFDWKRPETWTDAALLERKIVENSGRSACRWDCVANFAYPFDRRCFVEEDVTPIASELTSCGFFEQASDPDSSMTLEHCVKKEVPRACEKRAADSIMEQTASSCPAFSAWLLGVIRCFLMGSYGHARKRPPFWLAVTGCKKFLREAELDLAARIAEADLRPLAEKHARKRVKMERAICMFGEHQFWGALDVMRLMDTAASCVSALVGRDDAEPFTASAALMRQAVAKSVTAEAVRRLAGSPAGLIASEPAFAETFGATFGSLAAGGWSMEDLVGDCVCVLKGSVRTKLQSEIRALAAAIDESVALLGGGGLSSRSEPVVDESAKTISALVAEALRAAYGDAKRATCVSSAFRRPDELFSRFRRTLCDALVTLSKTGKASDAAARERPADAGEFARKWPLSPESVSEVCAATCARVLETLIAAEGAAFMPNVPKQRVTQTTDKFCQVLMAATIQAASALDVALVSGIGTRALLAMSGRAADVVDVWDPAVTTCMEPKERTAAEKARILMSASSAMHEVPRECEDVLRFSDSAKMIEIDLLRAAKSKKANAALAANRPLMARMARELLQVIGILRASPSSWGRPPSAESTGGSPAVYVPADAHLSPERLMLLAGRLASEVIGFAGGVANTTARFADSMAKCELLRRSWERHVRVSEKLAGQTSFVVRHAVICRYALREAVLVQMSRNPALVATFVTRGSWFPEFMDHVVRACDTMRDALTRRVCKVPPNEEMSAMVENISRGTWWASKVYRLHKWDFASRVAKTCEQHEALITTENLKVGPAFRIGEDRVKLMREYVFASVAATGADRRPNLQRDLADLWRFGMRDHGLAIVAGLHGSHGHFGGRNEVYKLISQLSVAEFLLLSEYYRALVSANSVMVIPLMSPFISETTAATLRERYGLADGEIPKQLMQLVLCDVCFSVLTQMPPRLSIRPSKLTSCYAVVSGPDGELVCLDKRNSIKKKAGGKRKQIRAEKENKNRRSKQKKAKCVDDRSDEEGEEEEEEVEESDGEDEETAAAVEEDDHNVRTHALACQRCHSRRGMPTSERLGLRMQLKCQETRVREVPGAGCVVEFGQKYTAKGEKSTDARLPVILAPCCGTWRRFSFSDWGPDGYRCRACSHARGTGPALPSTCAVCGRENKTFASAGGSAKKSESAKLTTTTTTMMAAASPTSTWVTQNERWIPAPVAIANDEHKRRRVASGNRTKMLAPARKRRKNAGDGDDENSDGADGVAESQREQRQDDSQFSQSVVVKNKKKYKAYELRRSSSASIPGRLIPAAEGVQNVICVIDDDVTNLLIPVGVCKGCYCESVRLSRTVPLLMSQLRASVKRRMLEPKMLHNTCRKPVSPLS